MSPLSDNDPGGFSDQLVEQEATIPFIPIPENTIRSILNDLSQYLIEGRYTLENILNGTPPIEITIPFNLAGSNTEWENFIDYWTEEVIMPEESGLRSIQRIALELCRRHIPEDLGVSRLQTHVVMLDIVKTCLSKLEETST